MAVNHRKKYRLWNTPSLKYTVVQYQWTHTETSIETIKTGAKVYKFGTKISNFGPDPHYNINLSFKNVEHIAFLKLHNLFKNLEDMENV